MWRTLLGRERKAAGRLVALSLSPPAAWTPRDYAAYVREGYARNAVTHRCIRLIAEAVAAVPLRAGDQAEGSRRALDLINAPNPDEAGQELLESFIGALQVAGNAYMEFAGGEEGPQALYMLRPDRMRVIAGPKGWADAWEYRAGGERRVFERDRARARSPVLHMKLFNPGDDHYGLPPMEAAARAVDVHNAGGAWAKALLDNAARPSGALVVAGREGGDARLTESQYERLKTELEELYTGPANAGRPLLLEGGLDWKPMGQSPSEMDFIELRREAAREIALAFGVPPMLLGLPGDNTYSNYKEANLAFHRQTVLPLARKTARALSRWLSPWIGPALLEPEMEPPASPGPEPVAPEGPSPRSAATAPAADPAFLGLEEARR